MISVCLASYNGQQFIKEQIDSIISQLDAVDELIVSDDGSTDNTLLIVESYNDPRIKILKGCFQSPIYNFENALMHAKGDYIFLSDQDDIWNADKIRIMANYLKDYDCVVSDAIVVDENENVLIDSFMTYRGSKKGKLNNLIKNSYLGCCMAFNRRILDLCLPFPGDIPMHDIWIGAIAEEFGRTIFIKDKLVKYRRHTKTVTHTETKSNNSFKERIRFRYRIIINLVKRKNEIK